MSERSSGRDTGRNSRRNSTGARRPIMNIISKRVVVIGGTSGIGLATARAAAERGAEVVVVSAREASVQRALAQLPEGVTGHAVDVRDDAALNALFERIGSLDHLVYTSGESLAL